MSQKFKKAKFRNAEFYLKDSDAEFGRRQVTHEYPQRDTPYTEDLGRKARKFSFEGYVVGANTEAEKKAVIDAVETSGPGILIHPYYGQRNVCCLSLRVNETAGENRIVRFSFEFEEAGEAVFPSASVDTAFALKGASGALGAGAMANFANRFDLKGKPQFLVDSAVEKLTSVTARIQSLVGNANEVFRASADISFALRNLKAATNDLVNSPSAIAAQLRTSFNLLSDTFQGLAETDRSKFKAQTALLFFGATEEPAIGVTSNRLQEEENRQAMNDLVKALALEQAANAATEIQFTNLEDALAVRDQLVAAMDEQELTASDDMFLAIADLRTKVFEAIPSPRENLSSLVTFTPRVTRNSLELAYELYGSLKLEPDLISRNNVRHPGLIPGGQPLEVLSSE